MQRFHLNLKDIEINGIKLYLADNLKHYIVTYNLLIWNDLNRNLRLSLSPIFLWKFLWTACIRWNKKLNTKNYMVTTLNEPWLLNIPLSERISTTLTTLEENRASESESIFTLSSSMSSSFLFGVIAALLEGYFQNIPLSYSINDSFVYINLFIDLVFLQFSQLITSILY